MKLCVLGAGSWGIALSVHLHKAGHSIRLWEFDSSAAAGLKTARENKTLLPGIKLPEDVLVTPDLKEALIGRDGVVLAVPSHVLRQTIQAAVNHLPPTAWLVSAAKGLEENSHLRMSKVLKEYVKDSSRISVLSGPSHAEEVSRGMPTTVVAASTDAALSNTVQGVFHSDHFRVYTSSDIAGVEYGGAFKNVIAIAAGISDGLGLGDNAKAALMTRGLHEITKLGITLGAQASTFAGLTGMGDLIVTCCSRYSRNRLLGEKIGKGKTPEQALKEMVMVAEGVKTSHAAFELARQAHVEVPITHEVYHILFKDKSARAALKSLMTRSAKPEQETAGW